jgi:hypothetical protein
MKRYLKIAFLMALLALVGGGLIAFLMYNKPHRNIEKSKVDFTLTATELLNAFELNPHGSGKEFTGKIIVVSGTINSIKRLGKDVTIILSAENGFFGVNCSFSANAKLPYETMCEGALVNVKGVCKGYLDDVILSDCYLVE